MTTTRPITITTDATSAAIEATSGDDAARQFAASKYISGVTDCATLCDHYREIGGAVRVIDTDGSILCRVAESDRTEYTADLATALEWVRTASDGNYLVKYEDTGLTDEQDPGSRCGYSDPELNEIRAALQARGLTLQADDQGLMAARRAV